MKTVRVYRSPKSHVLTPEESLRGLKNRPAWMRRKIAIIAARAATKARLARCSEGNALFRSMGGAEVLAELDSDK